MEFNIIPFHSDGRPLTREVMDGASQWESVVDRAKSALVRYPEATSVIITDHNSGELWRWPERVDT